MSEGYIEDQPEYWDAETGEDETYGDNDYPQIPHALVEVVGQGQRVAPEFNPWSSFSIPLAGSASPIQILQRRYHRYKAKFTPNIPAATTLYFANTPQVLMAPAIPSTVAAFITGQNIPDYDGMQPLYAVYTGTGPVTITVLDESYGPVK